MLKCLSHSPQTCFCLVIWTNIGNTALNCDFSAKVLLNDLGGTNHRCIHLIHIVIVRICKICIFSTIACLPSSNNAFKNQNLTPNVGSLSNFSQGLLNNILIITQYFQYQFQIQKSYKKLWMCTFICKYLGLHKIVQYCQ